jgi:hypothetical protein
MHAFRAVIVGKEDVGHLGIRFGSGFLLGGSSYASFRSRNCRIVIRRVNIVVYDHTVVLYIIVNLH